MNKRQKEVQQAFLDNEKKVLKKLEKNYQDALDEINSKIELLMARQDADMQHVIYQVEYQKALKTQVQSILETLQANEFETVSEYLANSYHDGFIGTMYDLHGQGIPLIFPIDQEAVVAAVQQETKLSEPLYTAMGKDITDLKKKITGEISRGLSSGQMYGEITRNIASWARIPKNNAARIARTEAHRIQCKATADAQFRAKEKGADVVKQWDASLDKKTRDSHVQVDGEIRELDERFSNGLRYPGDPSGGAAEVINCRCALLQRARWALGNDYTKWSPDAEIEYSDDGTAQLAIIDAKSFKEFKGYYMDATRQMTMNFENGTSSRVRRSTQKITAEEQKPKNYTSEEVSKEMFKQYKKRYDEEGLEGKWAEAEALQRMDAFRFNVGSKMSAESSQKVQNQFVKLLNKYKSGVTNVSYAETLQDGFNSVSPLSRGLTYTSSNGTSTIKILDQSDSVLFRELADSAKSKFNIKGLREEDYPVYYLTHEFGHSLVSLADLKKDHVNYERMKEFSGKIETLYQEYKSELRRLAVDRSDLRKATSKEFAQAMLTGDTEKMQEIQKKLNEFDAAVDRVKISDYAGANADEFLAESFALAELSTESSPYADKVMELVKEYFGR